MKTFKFLVFSAVILATAAFAVSTVSAAEYEPKVGLQTYSCRNMSFDEVVDFAVKHHIKYLQAIGKHIDPNGSIEETKRKKAILDEKGLVCYTFGVAGTSLDKEKNRKLFEFAKLMGIKVIVVEPKNPAEWDNLEELVKEYDIKLAIHNHGRDSVYGTPEKVKAVLDKRDRRIGVCMDVGHITGAGFDAAKAFSDYDGRVYDIHLKDKRTEKTADGKSVILDVMVGTGDANYAGLLAELKKAKWDGVMAIETDNATFAKEPAEFVTGAIKFVKEHAK
ncbi:MAG: sugar phosphate isomerase/epimerase [Verrucomicrobia bacterium]|nr:sugar phosphate isomerase/epimerase [Verrucomicrobiota bacterium]